MATSRSMYDSIKLYHDDVNTRWMTLCRKLGIAFKDAEETVFLLKLLEAVLTQLNKWLYRVHQQQRAVKRDSCNVHEMQHALDNIEVCGCSMLEC